MNPREAVRGRSPVTGEMDGGRENAEFNPPSDVSSLAGKIYFTVRITVIIHFLQWIARLRRRRFAGMENNSVNREPGRAPGAGYRVPGTRLRGPGSGYRVPDESSYPAPGPRPPEPGPPPVPQTIYNLTIRELTWLNIARTDGYAERNP
jgi:hypothetical protein